MENNKFIISEFYDFKLDSKLIKEAELGKKQITLSGILQKANTLNRNGRVYPYDILKREATKYMELVDEGRALGSTDHADSAVVSLMTASHKVIDMWWQGEELYGKVELLDELCPASNVLRGLLKSKVKLGISSRGIGSVKSVRGQDIVQEDFELISFDFVSSPSTPGAFLFMEGKQWGLTPITEQEWKKIKCENGICRLITEGKNKDFNNLITLSNKNFWKKVL